MSDLEIKANETIIGEYAETAYYGNTAIEITHTWISAKPDTTPEFQGMLTRCKNVETLESVDWNKVSSEVLSQIITLLS